VECSKQSATCRWQEEDQLQLRYGNQPLHNNHDSDEENVENFRVREKYFPLCFSSFQFLKRNSRPVVNSEDKKFSDQSVEDAIVDMKAFLNPELQPLTDFDFQILDERLKLETNYELIQNKSVPLCFNSFQFLKNNLEYMLKDKHIESQNPSCESMKQSCKSFQDPIAAILDDYVVEFDDDYSKKPTLSSSEEEVQLPQSQDDNQNLHTNQDCKEENAENFQENANCLPLCFASLLREHFKKVINRKDEECSNASVDENKGDT
jgi:hypothetical protein